MTMGELFEAGARLDGAVVRSVAAPHQQGLRIFAAPNEMMPLEAVGTGYVAIPGPQFRKFGDAFYTYQILLYLKVEKGLAVRTEPHPRFYTDRTDTVPIAVPALIQEIKRRGHPEELIRKVVFENPLTFWRQCSRWQDWTGYGMPSAEKKHALVS